MPLSCLGTELTLDLQIQPSINDPEKQQYLNMGSFHVQHTMKQYTIIPHVLYVRRWGMKRWGLSFGSKGRVTYN